MARRYKKKGAHFVRFDASDTIKSTFNNMDKYSEEVQAKIVDAVKATSDDIMDAAKSRIHSVTGTLANSIRADYNAKSNTGTVTAYAPHAHLVEFGAGPAFETPKQKLKRTKKGGAKALTINGAYRAYAMIPSRKAKPFLKPAAEQCKGSLEAKIKEALDEV